METMSESAPASNGARSGDRGTPPEEVERNNETQRSEGNIARTDSLGGGGAGGGTRRNHKEADKQAFIVYNGKQQRRHAVVLSTAKRTGPFEEANIHGWQIDAAEPLKEMLKSSCGAVSAEALETNSLIPTRMLMLTLTQDRAQQDLIWTSRRVRSVREVQHSA
jgi:hypothetical protein